MYKLLCDCYPFPVIQPHNQSREAVIKSYILQYAALFNKVDYSKLSAYPNCVDFISKLLNTNEYQF